MPPSVWRSSNAAPPSADRTHRPTKRPPRAVSPPPRRRAARDRARIDRLQQRPRPARCRHLRSVASRDATRSDPRARALTFGPRFRPKQGGSRHETTERDAITVSTRQRPVSGSTRCSTRAVTGGRRGRAPDHRATSFGARTLLGLGGHHVGRAPPTDPTVRIARRGRRVRRGSSACWRRARRGGARRSRVLGPAFVRSPD